MRFAHLESTLQAIAVALGGKTKTRLFISMCAVIPFAELLLLLLLLFISLLLLLLLLLSAAAPAGVLFLQGEFVSICNANSTQQKAYVLCKELV